MCGLKFSRLKLGVKHDSRTRKGLWGLKSSVAVFASEVVGRALQGVRGLKLGTGDHRHPEQPVAPLAECDRSKIRKTEVTRNERADQCSEPYRICT